MKRIRSVLHLAALSATFLVLSTSAWADITGDVYRVYSNWGNAPYSLSDLGTLGTNYITEGSFTAPQVNFTTEAGGVTLGGFLAYGSANTAGMTGGLGDAMSDASTSSFKDCSLLQDCYSTVIHITGFGTFVNGTTYHLRHDDGANMNVNGTWVVNSATPTSPISNDFIGAGGAVNFDIWYMGTNRNPEVLQLTPNVATPEPGVISLLVTMLTGLSGVAVVLKKKLA